MTNQFNNKFRLHRFISIVLMATCCQLAGMAQKPITINEILQRIQAANPLSRMYDADIRSMEEAAKGAKSWMPPEVGIGLFMTPYNTARWKQMSDMEPGMGSVMISAQQMIPNKRKLNADAALMKSMSAATTEQKKAALNELFAEAKKAYYEWQILEKKIGVLKENEKILEFMVNNAELRYRNGMEKLSAYYKAKAALGNSQSMQLMLANEIAQKRIMLNTLMYDQSGKMYTIDTAVQLKSYEAYQLDSTLLAGTRSDIKAVDRLIITNLLRIDAERLSLKPQFGIRFDHMIGFGKQPQQFTLMGMVKLPFVSWASGMTKANIESYKWKSAALSSERDMLINEAVGMSKRMIAEINTKKRQLQLYELNILPALRNNYKSMLLGYEQNTEELFMLFDAWETLNMTQNAYLDLLQQLLSMQVELERILEIKN